MRICLYEDRRSAQLHPLTLTRPASELLCGLTTIAQKQIRYFGAEVVGQLCRPVFADWLRNRDPLALINEPVWLRSAPTILVNGRWLPPANPVAHSARNWFADGSFVGTVAGEPAFAVLSPRRLQSVTPTTVDDCVRDWTQSLPHREVGGTLFSNPWELIDRNGQELARDFDATCDPTAAGFHPTGLALVGPADRLFIHPTARLDPLVVADTTAGPVVIGEGAVVSAFTRLEGPCAIGAHTHLLSAKVRGGTTIGPHCRIGGEVECSIILGYTNKYHDGFLGHSFVGEWVNLAAGTCTADLRCDYKTVSVPINGVEVSTGRTKAGSVIGDHAKTGLGVLLNCGSAIGTFAQVMPTGTYAPREVASFTRSGPDGVKQLDVTRVLATADVVMRRRGRELTPQLEAIYRALMRTNAGATATPGSLPLRAA